MYAIGRLGKFLCLLALLGWLSALAAQAQINWFTNLDDALVVAQQTGKKILVDVYTPWNGLCASMHQHTYTNHKVVEYINSKFCAVRLNAEDADSLHFQNLTFPYLPEKHANQLAYVLLNGHMSTPATVIMTSQAEVLSPVKGFLNVSQLLKVVHFFGDDAYKNTSWTEYQQKYSFE